MKWDEKCTIQNWPGMLYEVDELKQFKLNNSVYSIQN